MGLVTDLRMSRLVKTIKLAALEGMQSWDQPLGLAFGPGCCSSVGLFHTLSLLASFLCASPPEGGQA